MKLPQPLLQSIAFSFDNANELIQAIGDDCSSEEINEIKRLIANGLPPVVSADSLAVMFGYNPGFVWSLINRAHRYYRYFEIPKGKKNRGIYSPQVGLKVIQKWLSFHWQKIWTPNENTFGFVPGLSHVDAAKRHLSAQWVYSLDIENFFPSVSSDKVRRAISTLGYRTEASLDILTNLCCLRSNLVQGSPASPLISNIVLEALDSELTNIASENNIVFTRYADDIVFSGQDTVPTALLNDIKALIVQNGWTISEHKEKLDKAPQRLKVHGLLVHGEQVRLTKGYRNRIRGFQHSLDKNKIQANDLNKIKGHLSYASYIDKIN